LLISSVETPGLQHVRSPSCVVGPCVGCLHLWLYRNLRTPKHLALHCHESAAASPASCWLPCNLTCLCNDGALHVASWRVVQPAICSDACFSSAAQLQLKITPNICRACHEARPLMLPAACGQQPCAGNTPLHKSSKLLCMLHCMDKIMEMLQL
jgi:hypothetical protein